MASSAQPVTAADHGAQQPPVTLDMRAISGSGNLIDEVTNLAAYACDVEIAIAALYQGDQVVFTSAHGISGLNGIARDNAICVHALADQDFVEIADAAWHLRFRASPMVLAGPKVRFFAAVALRDRQGAAFGSLSIASPTAKTLSAAQKQALEQLGHVIASLFEAQAAQAAVARLGAVMDASFNPIFMLDPGTLRFTYANRGAQAALGYTREQLAQRVLCDVIPSCTPEQLGPALAALRSRAQPEVRTERELRRSDGSMLPAELVLQLSDEITPQLILVANDLSAHQAAQRALQASESRLRTITNNVPALVSYVDREERYQFVNSTYEKWFQRPADQIVGNKMEQLLGTEIYQRLAPYLKRAYAGEAVTFQNDVDDRHLQVNFVPDQTQHGVAGIYVLVNDVTARVVAEQRAAALDKQQP